MRKSYVFIFNANLGTNEDIKDYLNASEYVITWRKELDSVYFFVSDYTAQEIYNDVSQYFGKGKGIFLITEVTGNKQGLLNKRSWHLLNEKKLPPKEG